MGIMNKCVFCDYNGNKKIRETENTFTLLSNPYLLEGHCLVIPKNHYECLYEIPESISIELWFETINISRLLKEKFHVSGIDIRQNYRPFLRESIYKVNHVHIHVIPRENEDELYQKSMIFERDVFKELNEPLLSKLKETLQ